MKNKQLFPFERNRYYAGKMLTSADFQAEQNYFNNKRRFINRALYGAGIVLGCGVVSLDDLSLLVESGIAIDDYGREIVIESSVVKKLSAMEGFEQLKTSNVLLCLRYHEEEVHSVYCVNHQETGNEYEFNRINEGYELFLMDDEEKSGNSFWEEEFLINIILYRDEDFEIMMQMPAMVCKGLFVKIILTAKKLSDNEVHASFEGVLQMPEFISGEGSHELILSFEQLPVEMNSSVKQDYWVRVEEDTATEAEILIKKDSVKVLRDDQTFHPEYLPPVKINITDTLPEKLIASALGKPSLEMRDMGGKKDYLCLAAIQLNRADSAYFIGKLNENKVKRYIAAPAQYELRNDYLSYFYGEQEINNRKDDGVGLNRGYPDVDRSYTDINNAQRLMASGRLEIPIGDQAKKGNIYYSGEIMHGLGKGNVYITVGYENLSGEDDNEAYAKSTIYGDAELFRMDEEGIAEVETAIKVFNHKGSFIVAACLLKETDKLILHYQWNAVRFGGEDGGELLERYQNRSIAAVTPTVVLAPKESYFFEVRFFNMESCSIGYELTEAGSGGITIDGIYTAPDKEGVYEIRIYCTDMPMICTYAYVIVKHKEDNL